MLKVDGDKNSGEADNGAANYRKFDAASVSGVAGMLRRDARGLLIHTCGYRSFDVQCQSFEGSVIRLDINPVVTSQKVLEMIVF